MFRDLETGMPIAALQFMKSSSVGANGQPKFNIGYASGAGNGRIEAKYVNGVRDYLNSRADDIAGIGNNLEDNTGIYDTTNKPSLAKARRYAQVSENEMKAVDWNSMPRFMTAKDIKQAVQSNVPAVVPQQSSAFQEDIGQLKTALTSNIDFVINEAIQDSNLDAPEELERRLGIVFSAMQSQYFPTLLDDPVTALNRALEYLEYEIDRRSNNVSEISQEMAVALESYASELESARDDLVRQQQQPQRANLPAEVQQNIDQRNQDISNAYLNALIPNTNIPIIDETLSEFADMLSTMATNMFGNGYNASEIAENLAARVHAEHMSLVAPDRIVLRGLTPAEADTIRSRLNTAYGDLNEVREAYQVPNRQNQGIGDFEPDNMHGANEPYTMQSAVDMARDVFEQERMDANNFDIPSIEQSIYALREGLFDDERIRRLPENLRQSFAEDVAFRLQNMLDEMRGRQAPTPVPAQPATAPYTPIPAIIHAMSDQAITADMTPEERNRVQVMFETLTDVNMPGELQNIVSLARSYAMGFWENFSDVQREWLARNIEEYIGDNPPPNTPPPEEPPQRRGPFRPGGASAVRGVPLGNLNIQPSITAEAFKGPDRQPLSNFLQQVKSMPGVTQEGLKTGLMAFENMDPSRQMTKAEFARELLPSSYDIVDLANSSNRNEHDLEYLDDHLDDDDVIDQFKETHDIPENLYDDISTDSQYEDLSGKLQKHLAKKGIRNEEEFNNAIAAVRREIVEAQYETYLAENYPGEDITGDPYQYRTTQRLALDSEGDEYSEFGVTHPDQSGRYTHYPQAPEGVIGHVRGTYNPDGLEVKTTDADIFTTKSNSYVIEEIQSDAQKNSQQVAHLHQVHGVLFKAAIQKALELGADTVYLPTAKVIASERPSVEGWEARPDDRGLTMQVPIRKDTTSKFKPIYDQAIVKEGLKPLLKIPGVTSKLVSDGDYHEISFTPEAKEYILNGPGQTIPGYKKGGRIRKYQDGGSTSDYVEENNAALDDFERMKLERWMSKHPEFHVPSKEFNDDNPDAERDDDIHVPKASTFDAKLKTPWEDDQWMMRNYIRKHHMQTFAKGGTVQPIPSVEQMKRELMMRRA